MLLNLYSLLLIGVTLAVILSRRTMYAILFLILLFALIAIFVYSLGIDFIGLIFVIVYVGAIATLFLFIVMMLGGEDWEVRIPLGLETNNLLNASGFISSRLSSLLYKAGWYLKHIVMDLLIIFGFGWSVIQLVAMSFAGQFSSWLDLTQANYRESAFNSSFLYGVFFYDYWYLPFLLAGVVLFIAMLGSIVLTTRLLLPTSKDSPKSSTKDSLDLSEEERKRILSEPSPMLAQTVAKQKLELELPMALWAPQLAWSAVCLVVGFVCKDFFIVSELTRWIYVIILSVIYLVVSYKLVDRIAIKRIIKIARKS